MPLTRAHIANLRLRADSGFAPDDDDWNSLCDMALASLTLASLLEEEHERITVEVSRSDDGRVFANVIQGSRQLAHLKAGETYHIKPLIAASESLPQLTKGELEALIDFHDWNSSGAEAMEMIESSEYHEKRAAVFKAMRDKLEKEKVNAANR